ncbi:hypothetical protein F4808DRAFT_476187 [Astrocystis sublimbata]|nr:hypothetical protein F4808DRAFT_476187 [Astrocystis sublimbata]
MPKDAAVFTKSKPKGSINFQPYEDLDDISLHQVRRFQVYPLGKICEFSRHIPYNSGKKDFFEKTGRESFEVFQYVFKLPGDDVEYAVMWDYNIGLVRMTPFFKCCKYPKTTPAKMLNSNPGLKEITHSITGGSIMAQGYWMPYQCAKAVCATFCQTISGAMIPIFGPDFPSLCAQLDSPEYARMVIDPAIVIRSTREAEYYRHLYSNAARQDATPKREHRAFRGSHDEVIKNRSPYRIRRAFSPTPGSINSPYTTDTEGEASPVTDRIADFSRENPHLQPQRFPHSPIPSITASLRSSHASSGISSWTPVNIVPRSSHLRLQSEHQAPRPSPWLTALPRFTTTAHVQSSPYWSNKLPKPPRSQPYPAALSLSQPRSHKDRPRITDNMRPPPQLRTSQKTPPPFGQPTRMKRTAAHIEDDIITSGGSQLPAITLPQSNHVNKGKQEETQINSLPRADDKKAALLLMNLSVRDHTIWTTQGRDIEGQAVINGRSHERAAADSCRGNDTNRRANDARPEGDYGDKRGNISYQRQVGTGTGVHTARAYGGNGVQTAPLDGAFPRVKRIRSNSM